jgi:hypothetical protein
MSNKDLLKQAIAEAKTIREAAIANAKEALEESLTPHLKEMLALKLQEMEEDDMEEIVNEEDLINDPKGPTAHGNVAEAEEEEETEEAPEEEEEPAEEEEEEVEIEDMSVEDLKDLIRDIVSQELGNEEEAPEGEEMVGMEDEEEIDINEILAELAEGDSETDHEVMYEEESENAFDRWLTGVSAKLEKFGKENPVVQALEKAIDTAQKKAKELGITGAMTKGQKAFEEVTLNEEESETGFDAFLTKISNQLEKFGKESPVIQALEKAIDRAQEAAKKAGITGAITKGQKAFEQVSELEEALATVAQLRTQLQEVNLLNAKLLYVNKVFKANNLTEGQKVNVVAAFDKAETVKEVKLVYETVSKNVSTKQPVKQAIKEHTSFASRPAGTTQKQVINEVSEAVKRMQILAGIREREN